MRPWIRQVGARDAPWIVAATVLESAPQMDALCPCATQNANNWYIGHILISDNLSSFDACLSFRNWNVRKGATFVVNAMTIQAKTFVFLKETERLNDMPAFALQNAPKKWVIKQKRKPFSRHLLGAKMCISLLQKRVFMPCPPCQCNLSERPVCGSNGKTYLNACMAKCDGDVVRFRHYTTLKKDPICLLSARRM